jgi:hypothetical protein
LFVLEKGGDIDVAEFEALAEALDVKVNLRDPAKRAAEALKLHLAYGFRSTENILEHMLPWAEKQGKKVKIVLSYGRSRLPEVLEGKQRFDQMFIEYLEKRGIPYIDSIARHIEDYASFKITPDEYLDRYYIRAAVAAVFGHYSPIGNMFFAFMMKDEIVNWLDPKPPAYRD